MCGSTEPIPIKFRAKKNKNYSLSILFSKKVYLKLKTYHTFIKTNDYSLQSKKNDKNFYKENNQISHI